MYTRIYRLAYFSLWLLKLVPRADQVHQPVLKRRVALLRSISRPTDAIAGLVKLLEATPTDAEAWCELADLYKSQGMSSQAVFCLEESLLIAPNAWNVCVLKYLTKFRGLYLLSFKKKRSTRL